MSESITLTVNGSAHTIAAEPELPLLSALRGMLGLTATHFGCGANHCGACHLVNGVGMRVGPPLNGLSKRQSRSWVEDHFANPQKLVPGSIMPAYKLSGKDLENLTTYLFALPE